MSDLAKFSSNTIEFFMLVRGEYSLCETDVAAFQQELTESQTLWSLDCHESYDGDLTVLLTPPGEAEVTLVMNRDADGFHLAASHGDELRDLGVFESISSMISTLSSPVEDTNVPLIRKHL